MFRRFIAPTVEVSAHCDLPCGVYDPAQARIEAESIKAIDKKVADNDEAPAEERRSQTRARQEVRRIHLARRRPSLIPPRRTK